MTSHHIVDRADDIADGLALWQEFKPQSPEDWIRVAERFIDADSNANQASPEFRRLVKEWRHG